MGKLSKMWFNLYETSEPTTSTFVLLGCVTSNKVYVNSYSVSKYHSKGFWNKMNMLQLHTTPHIRDFPVVGQSHENLLSEETSSIRRTPTRGSKDILGCSKFCIPDIFVFEKTCDSEVTCLKIVLSNLSAERKASS